MWVEFPTYELELNEIWDEKWDGVKAPENPTAKDIVEYLKEVYGSPWEVAYQFSLTDMDITIHVDEVSWEYEPNERST